MVSHILFGIELIDLLVIVITITIIFIQGNNYNKNYDTHFNKNQGNTFIVSTEK